MKEADPLSPYGDKAQEEEKTKGPAISYRNVLGGVIFAALFISVLFATTISYTNTDAYLQHEFSRQVNSSEEYLSSSTLYIHRGLKLWDSTYDRVMQEVAEKTAESYIEHGRNASAVNLSAIAASLPEPYQSRIRIDLINQSGIVEYSYRGETGLDFSEWGVFFQDLTRIREGSEFVPDRVVVGFNSSAPLTKYAYLPTDDHAYVIEPALLVGDDQVPERHNLSYLSLISRVKENNNDLIDIAIYNSMRHLVISTFPKDNPLVFPWTKQNIKDVLNDTSTRERWDNANHTYFRYVYLKIAEDNAPSSRYMDLIAEMVYSTDRVEKQQQSNLFLHIILALIALILVICIGYVISSRLTRPIQEILDDIDQISSGDLSHTIRRSSHVELNRIADAVNMMIRHIQSNLQEIKNSESKYFGLFHASAHAILILEGTRVVNINKAAEDLFQVQESAISGSDVRSLFHEAGPVIANMIDRADRNNQNQYQEEFSSYLTGGEEKYLSIRLTRVMISNGQINQVQIQDLTEQRRAFLAFAEQEALRNAYAELQKIFELLPDPTFIINTEGAVILWNKAMESLTGVSAEEMMGKDQHEYAIPVYGTRKKMLIDYALHPEDIIHEEHLHIEHIGDLLTTHTWHEYGGKKYYLSALAGKLYDQKGEVIGAIESIRDITHVRKTQDALYIANRKINLLSKISRHDILNQVTILSGLVYLLAMDIQNPVLKDMLGRMKNVIHVIQAQINFSKEYQEIGSSEAIWVNPVDLFLKQEALFSGTGITFQALLSEIVIFADPLFEKVIYNLIDNSIRHGIHASCISLSVRIIGEFAEITYEDDGTGIAPEEKTRIFDQNYGKNTGNGLFLIREILSITEITIEENGVYGKGARFVLTIPPGGFQIKK